MSSAETTRVTAGGEDWLGVFQGNNLPAENADLLKPALLCGKGLVSAAFSSGEFLAFGIEFLSQNRDAGLEPSRLGFHLLRHKSEPESCWQVSYVPAVS